MFAQRHLLEYLVRPESTIFLHDLWLSIFHVENWSMCDNVILAMACQISFFWLLAVSAATPLFWVFEQDFLIVLPGEVVSTVATRGMDDFKLGRWFTLNFVANYWIASIWNPRILIFKLHLASQLGQATNVNDLSLRILIRLICATVTSYGARTVGASSPPCMKEITCQHHQIIS